MTESQDLALMLCSGTVNIISISSNSTCLNSSPVLRGIQYFQADLLQHFTAALNYFWLPLAGVLLQWVLVQFSSLSLQPFIPCRCMLTPSITDVTRSLFYRKPPVFTPASITLCCRHYVTYLNLVISYTKPLLKSFFPLNKPFSIYNKFCSPCKLFFLLGQISTIANG